MNPVPMIRSLCTYLDSIVLRPSITMSLSSYNRRSGACSEQKSLSISTGITLLRAMLVLGGTVATFYAVVRLFQMKERKMLMRSLKKENKRKKIRD